MAFFWGKVHLCLRIFDSQRREIVSLFNTIETYNAITT